MKKFIYYLIKIFIWPWREWYDRRNILIPIFTGVILSLLTIHKIISFGGFVICSLIICIYPILSFFLEEYLRLVDIQNYNKNKFKKDKENSHEY